jgi:hypothetical protein
MYASRSGQRRAGFAAPHHHLRARIASCRLFREDAASPEEREGWLAEEAGLIDALLGLDQTAVSSHQVPPRQRDRYAVGLHDGRSILMADRPGTCQRDGTGED